MTDHMIISLNRQFGSGGKEVGTKLAKELGVKLYDNEIIELASEKAVYVGSILKRWTKSPQTVFLYALAMNTFSMNSSLNPL